SSDCRVSTNWAILLESSLGKEVGGMEIGANITAAMSFPSRTTTSKMREACSAVRRTSIMSISLAMHAFGRAGDVINSGWPLSGVDSRAMTTAAFLEENMRPSFRTIVVSTLTLIVSSTLATAAKVRVLSVGSTLIAAKAIATEFEKQTGHKVTFTIRPPFDIDKELAEKTFDAVILSVPAMDNHDEAGDLAPMSRVALARVGVGVVVKEGGPVPDVSTPEKLKAAVLAARSLTYTDPATPNTSGAIAAA